MQDPKAIINILENLKSWKTNDFPRLSGIRAESYFKNNFRLQGYQDNGLTKWQPRKNDDRKGGAILVGKRGGTLRDSLRAVVSGGNIRIETNTVYANIHNEGGTIIQTVTAKQRAFFWVKYYQYKDAKQLTTAERWKRMALSKTLTIVMPQRQFIPKPMSGQLPMELAQILQNDIEKKLNTLIGEI